MADPRASEVGPFPPLWPCDLPTPKPKAGQWGAAMELEGE